MKAPELAIEWRSKRFQELTPQELHDAIHLRESVFVLEQNCVYLDVDGRDPLALHVLAYAGQECVATARVFPAGVKFAEKSVGRVATALAARGMGLGRRLMERAIEAGDRAFGSGPYRISAQQYLERFYTSFGFERVSAESYLEDGIPHVEMLRE